MEKEQEKDMIELPQVHIPDEITQVTGPEIGITTSHPDPSSHPNAIYGYGDADFRE